MLIVFKVENYLPNPDKWPVYLRRIKMNYDLRGYRIKTKWFARFLSTYINQNLGIHVGMDYTYVILGKIITLDGVKLLMWIVVWALISTVIAYLVDNQNLTQGWPTLNEVDILELNWHIKQGKIENA